MGGGYVQTRCAAVLASGALSLCVALTWPSLARGQISDRTAIVRVLRESRDFRARTRAALALGASTDPNMATPLASALRDPHPAVRAAAAEGLGRIGDRAHLDALRALANDPERAVREAASRAMGAIEARSHAPSSPTTPVSPLSPFSSRPAPPIAPTPSPPNLGLPPVQWERTRYVVVLGAMENRSGYPHPDLAQVLRREVARGLSALAGVAVLPGAPDAASEQEISRRRIRRYRLDGSIRTVRAEPGRDVRVRCEVSLLLLDDPGQNIRANLTGAATGTEPPHRDAPRPAQEQRLAERALEGAVRSAMNGASRAIVASAGGR